MICGSVLADQPGNYGPISLDTSKCPNSKRATSASVPMLTINLSGTLTVESLYLGSGTTLDIVNGDVTVKSNLTLDTGSNFIKSENNPPITVSGCVSQNGNQLTVTGDNLQGSISVAWFSTTCSVGKYGQITATSSSNSQCYSIPSSPTYLGGSVNLNVNSVPCPVASSPPSPVAWIVPVVIIVIILVVIAALLAVPKTRQRLARFFRKETLTSRSGIQTRKSVTRELSHPDRELPDPPFNVTAIADYTAVDSTQMTIYKGTQYTVTRVDEGHHWFQSRMGNGKLGWFPASYAALDKEL